MKIPPEKFSEIMESLKPMPPDSLAQKVLNAVATNKAIIIEPPFWKIIWWLNRLSPVLGVAMARHSCHRMGKNLI